MPKVHSMTKRLSLLVAAVLAAAALSAERAPSADAGVPKLGRTVLAGGNPSHRLKYQRWIDAARFKVRQARATVIFRESNCPGTTSGISACVIQPAFFSTKLRFYIPKALLNPAEYDPVDLKNTVLHELGHVYDFKYNADHHRSQWMKIFAIPGSFFADEENPPYERFAVGYSYCAEGLTFEQAASRLVFDLDDYDYAFTREQHAAVCAMLAP